MSQEQLTPQQAIDYGTAYELAHQASKELDTRHLAATELAEYIVAKLSPTSPNARKYKTEFTQADQDFHFYNVAANTLMPARAVFDALEAKPPSYDERLASKEVWSAMSPEQQAKAAELRAAVAAGELKEHGVREDTLRVVMTETDGKKAFSLIHTGKGVDIGDPKQDYDPSRSRNQVMSEKNDSLFTIKIGDVTYDTRQGMTDAVYAAKVADARERGVMLPDSKPLSQEISDDWTWTMLTGEPLTADGNVPVRNVSEGKVGRHTAFPDYGDRDLRVCPAVVI